MTAGVGFLAKTEIFPALPKPRTMASKSPTKYEAGAVYLGVKILKY